MDSITSKRIISGCKSADGALRIQHNVAGVSIKQGFVVIVTANVLISSSEVSNRSHQAGVGNLIAVR